MNVLIPFRNTCGFNEINTCIKLINKNLKLTFDYDTTIYVVGDKIDTEYGNVINVEVEEQKYNKWLDSNFLTGYYIRNVSKRINDPFILFNDDFFLTGEVYDIPAYFYSTLEERIKTTYVVDYDASKVRLSAYGLNILKFIELHGDFNNYEVHVPIIIEHPEKMLEAIKISKENDCPALKRTLYRYLCGQEGLELKPATIIDHDVKFREPLAIIQYPFFSLTDKEFSVFKSDFEDILNK